VKTTDGVPARQAVEKLEELVANRAPVCPKRDLRIKMRAPRPACNVVEDMDVGIVPKVRQRKTDCQSDEDSDQKG